jgi:CRP/FNR family transcriptional regulator, cyclic AMP receptor protein
MGGRESEKMIHVAEFAGYLAALLVFLTFYMKTMIPLRIVGICSNCAFIAYGYLGGLYPVLILHLILLPLNGLRLREMLRLTRQVRTATHSDLKMDWLKPFTSARRISAGDILFRKGDAAGAMYFVVSGRCRLHELEIDILAGQVVGELALLAPDQSRTQTLECIENGEVLQITYDQVRQLYYQNSQFGFYFLQLIAQRLFQNIARLESELATRKVEPALPTTR